MRIKYIIGLSLLLSAAAWLYAADLTGREVLEKALKRYRGDDSTITILLTKSKLDNPADKKQFEITTFSLARPDVTKALVSIKRVKAADSKPILFLVWDWQDPKRADQLWYYLPSLGKYNSISSDSGEKMTEEFGFSIEEMKSRNLDAATHTNEGLVDYQGEKCYKIVSVPKDPKKEGFSKVTVFVRPDSWTAAFVEYIGLDGKPLRSLRVSKVEKVDGIWSEMAGEQKEYSKKYAVTFEMTKAEYNKKISPNLFSFTQPPQQFTGGK